MSTKQRFIQVILEGFIPLLGFFFWNWSLYFILLFYFIDMIANEGIMHLKSKKTQSFQQKAKNKQNWIKKGVISSVLLIFSIVLIHFSMFFIVPEIKFYQEFLAFLNYEEMGIKQGYILIPLVVLLSYQQYKMTFLMRAKFRTTEMTQLWKTHIQAIIAIIAFGGLCLGIAQLILLPELVYVLGIILFSSLYRLRFGE
ncbi:MAG: hypothetical protein COA33_001850 [Fluviicola sp.]|nr:hypothetical protein [Fluviicola sp.]